MPKINEEAVQARRDRIIQAAAASFADKGLSRVTLRDVFHEAGLSAGAVYNYYPSKEELVVAVAEAGLMRTLNSVGSEAASGKSLDELIGTFFESLATMKDAQAARLDIMLATEALVSPSLNRTVRENRKRIRAALIAAIVADQQHRPHWKGLDAESLAILLMAAFQGLILAIALGEEPDVPGVREAVLRLRQS